ncbi:hypothetical protein [Micromonospora sp. RV43]|uniref:hypothetical protein n=1 Tax=Micromonospora sp. RV43 TaxID=1661387 RepID=UPI00064BF27B|nr:hypothetical protein [Micromonospora sp. RV43]
MRARLKRFDLNRSEIARMAVGPEVHRVCREVAEVGKRFAERIAPRSAETDNEDHEHYADQFVLIDVLVTDVGDPPMARRGVHLANLSPKAKLIEVGATHKAGDGTARGFLVLHRTAESLGSGFDARHQPRSRKRRARMRRRYR